MINMDYELILFIIGTIMITGGSVYILNFLRLKGYNKGEIVQSLNTSRLLLRFVTVNMSRKMKDSHKALFYTDLILHSIDYLQELMDDVPKNDKIERAMHKIYEASNKLNIKLTNEEKEIVKDILVTAYEMYVLVNEE
jgi:transcriptional regulator